MASCTRLVAISLSNGCETWVHGRLAHMQPDRDLGVGQAPPDLDEDLPLAIGEAGEPVQGVAAARGPGPRP